MGTVRTTSGLKSRPRVPRCHYQPPNIFNEREKPNRYRSSHVPVSLFWTRLYTASARSFLVSWASANAGKDRQSPDWNYKLGSIALTVENIILICLQLTKRTLRVCGDPRELLRSQFGCVIIHISRQVTLQLRQRRTYSLVVSYPRPPASISS